MTDDEKSTLRAAMVLLENATSNALDPVHRESWKKDREIVLIRLQGMTR